ncbi:hypothetical protein BH09MYX1_BH09MYX1_07670 [soil metagenome]
MGPRLPLSILPAFLLLLAPAVALAEDDPTEPPAVPEDLQRLVLDTGRIERPKVDPNYLRLHLRGELQLRGQVMRSFPLDVSATTINANPGATEDSLGQNAFVTQWIRLTPELTWREKLRFVAQVDLLQGYVFGQTTHDATADMYPRDNSGDAWTYIRLRWLYGEWRSPIGLLRVGQMSNHWGMGILANDGDRPSIFGDYRGGNIQEQILFATKPAGEKSPFVLAGAFSIVYQDSIARLTRGDVAFQGVLSGFYEKGPNQLGVFSVLRSQNTVQHSGSDLYTYDDDLVIGAIDVAGRFAVPVPGNEDTFLFGSAEGAFIVGSTNILRQPDQASSGQRTAIRSFGVAAAIGFVHRKHCACGSSKPMQSPMGPPDAPDTFGSVVAQLEVGDASGDANPYDDVERRFTFDPNHRVGLLLFDEVMRWQTSRASTAAQDPLLTNGTRPTPGVNLLPSNGGIYGATYINPTFIYRPVAALDLKAGAVMAQSSADVVDPYRLATQGAYVNYRGCDPRRHDLGLELDLGIEGRIKLDESLRLQLGAQGAILFPGGALANAAGETMNTPWLVTGRVGLQF